MKRRYDYSHSERKKIENIIFEISKNENDEIKSYLSKYLVVRISGYFEQQIQIQFVNFARNKSAPFISSFVEQKLNRWTNASAERIIDLANSFNVDWGKELTEFFDDEIKDKVNSLITVRNKIAHGDDTGITLSRAQEFFDAVERVVDKIILMLNE